MISDALGWQPTAALQRLSLPWLQHAGVEVAMLRLDRIDTLISGNKWFKLSDHLKQAVTVGAQGVISLGGAHSNHLHALAAAGKRFGFPTVGLLRGHAQQTPTVLDLQAFGMQLHWLGYTGYRARHAADFWQPWQARYPELYPIVEGGGRLAGALGCARLREMVDSQLGQMDWDDYHGWWLAAGTGTTVAGLLLAEAGAHPVYGAMAVPDDHGIAENIMAVLGEAAGSQEKAASELPAACVLLDASRGGFARTDPALLNFIASSEVQGGVLLEPLYTGKALLALHDEVLAGRFEPGTRLVFVHTGGLQGRRAMGL
ncbi:1-aminocyclopropane-1-carboxylate deaminase/D-cysteine desulfhydrase [Pseudomonas syringae group genomosp. 3]|uniref:1-aminocyclopropane-1-carboxylate deaminase/D-cysteine desulfhydrase n=1 Tax=Pseudomonas syringae group genomosp. 3 TaxID=251701 RepID=UPI0006E5EA56|nr:pyridoxal-phosphate dependent enzyme [Pseudomonas syringae group genomosp. 3]KPW55798.1 putative 1-aminocyclopropane-1-carboxylate deaminase [Pseudomonas syringae pv. berberidis]KPY25968.1 putative 1-aminocyclopropane-1-carboxylate deaminase [Pseudomonas syringae pv. philadelphi]RMM22378.1 putative 1-aminocyclopropane-1-carboxylate deaminase [Pseudomonas syringae pv. berberidis]RMP71365.1 putative 1-aminocyclopropane-1-carboxylate deaminase [Pseudomonas syringae pv. berberidis]RMQ32231.1 pu